MSAIDQLMDHGMLGMASLEPEIPQDDEYENVEGLDRASIECTRIHEAAAARKTANDYQHIIWAYGVLWSLFAIYGVMLWRRGQRLRADVETLRTRIDRA